MFRSLQSRNDGSSAALIDIAPLIDIVFILLIFFLVTATFVRDTGVEVLRPEATTVSTVEPTSIRVSVTAGGDVYTDGTSVTLDQLQAKVRRFVDRERMRSVIVIPDVEASAGRLMEVMDAARKGGATDVAVAARRQGAER